MIPKIGPPSFPVEKVAVLVTDDKRVQVVILSVFMQCIWILAILLVVNVQVCPVGLLWLADL